jgi:hypothetical protein
MTGLAARIHKEAAHSRNNAKWTDRPTHACDVLSVILLNLAHNSRLNLNRLAFSSNTEDLVMATVNGVYLTLSLCGTN